MALTEKMLTDTLKNYRNMKQRIREIENVTRAVDSVGATLLNGITIPSINSLHDSHVTKDPLVFSPDIMSSIIGAESVRKSEHEQLIAMTTLIEKMVMSLDDDSKDIIETLYYKGHTYDRTSEILDISRATVTARRKRAIQSMMRMI